MKALAAVTSWDSPGGVSSLEDLTKLNLYDNALGPKGCKVEQRPSHGPPKLLPLPPPLKRPF